MNHEHDGEVGAEQRDTEGEARRDFMKRIGKASAVAPAVGLLMAASFKSAQANVTPYGACGSGSGSS